MDVYKKLLYVYKFIDVHKLKPSILSNFQLYGEIMVFEIFVMPILEIAYFVSL